MSHPKKKTQVQLPPHQTTLGGESSLGGEGDAPKSQEKKTPSASSSLIFDSSLSLGPSLPLVELLLVQE